MNNILLFSGPPGTYAMISRMRDMYDTKLEDGNDILNLIQRNRLSMVRNLYFIKKLWLKNFKILVTKWRNE